MPSPASGPRTTGGIPQALSPARAGGRCRVREYIADVGVEQLDRWLGAVTDAPIIDEVFGSGSKH